MSKPLGISRPRFIDAEQALSIHEAAIGDFGGSPRVLDAGKLESALAQPQQSFGGQFVHEFPFEMAAAYGFHLAMNHPFEDGNKRVAWLAMVVFLRLNGWEVTAEDDHAADIILELIEQHRDKHWLADRLRSDSRPLPIYEVRDFFQDVTWERFIEQLRAFQVAQSDELLQASTDEAAKAIPIVQPLDDLGNDPASPETQAIFRGATISLVALYRIAEDMGYEW